MRGQTTGCRTLRSKGVAGGRWAVSELFASNTAINECSIIVRRLPFRANERRPSLSSAPALRALPPLPWQQTGSLSHTFSAQTPTS